MSHVGMFVMGFILSAFMLSSIISRQVNDSNTLDYLIDNEASIVRESRCVYVKADKDLYEGSSIKYSKNQTIKSECKDY